MPLLLPAKILLAWALLFCFVMAQGLLEKKINGLEIAASTTQIRALEISSLLGLVSMGGVLIFYFIHSTWYWTVALGLGGSIAGAFLLGLGLYFFGEASLGKRAFIGWPLCAIWAIRIIYDLAN